MMADIELWRDAPLWDPQSIAAATKTWFEYLGEKAVAERGNPQRPLPP